MAEDPAVEAGEVLAEEDEAHGDGAAGGVLPLRGDGKVEEDALGDGAVLDLVLGDAAVGGLYPLGDAVGLQRLHDEVGGDGLAGEGEPGDALAGV